MTPTSSEDFNSFPDCLMCGDCCRINVISMTEAELERIREYIQAEGIQPIDYAGERCCLQGSDGGCMVWPARAQICRLHHCKVPRRWILAEHPEIHVEDDVMLVNMHEEFIGTKASPTAFAMPLLDHPIQ